jgi:hypothetical protein
MPAAIEHRHKPIVRMIYLPHNRFHSERFGDLPGGTELRKAREQKGHAYPHQSYMAIDRAKSWASLRRGPTLSNAT